MKYTTIQQENVTVEQIQQILEDLNTERFAGYFYIIRSAWDLHFWAKNRGAHSPVFTFDAKKRGDGTIKKLEGRFPRPAHVHVIWMWSECRKAIASTFGGRCGCSERGTEEHALREKGLSEFLSEAPRGYDAFHATAPQEFIEKLQAGAIR